MKTIAQTLPVGVYDGIEDAYRRQQLLGLDTTQSSFMIRPMFITQQNDLNLSAVPNGLTLKTWNRLLLSNSRGSIKVYALPVAWQQQYNTHNPYGSNDGAMIPARGYQTMISGGLFAKIGFLTIQFRPEYVYAENKYFKESLDAANPASLQSALNSYYNRIDQPERFGNDDYSKFFWGQSSIRLNYGPVSLGLSNENLWWGPGIRSSLLMSNNAPGFKHVTLNTTRPVNTPIGSFETQIIGGKLDGSGIPVRQGAAYRAKPSDWRYLSGIVFTYHPKWVTGLFLGLDRTFTVYHNDMLKGIKSYIPFITSFEKKSFDNEGHTENSEDEQRRDQLFSLFARWVMPESNSEIYFQYGREDHSYDLRDAIVEPDHTRAYVAGFRKLFPLTHEPQYIQVGLELTQMEAAGTSKIRGETSWYTHSEVVHGYTNKGQTLGAGYGADNLQTLNVNWVEGLKKIGLFIERREHDNNLFSRAFKSSNEPTKHWVDLNLGSSFSKEFKRLILSSQFLYIRSFNYQYRYENQGTIDTFVPDRPNINNLHFKLELLYRL
jgi:hypothetical protein